MCAKTKAKPSKDETLSFFGETLVSAYRAAPYFLLASTAYFVSTRLLISYCLTSVFGWPENHRNTHQAAESLVPLFHVGFLVPAIIDGFMTHKYNPSEHLSKASPKLQDLFSAILLFCEGYMIYDFCFMLYFAIPKDSYWPVLETDIQMFMVHHAMIICYISQARYYQAGHMSAMMNMLLGELSNPLFNIYRFIKFGSEINFFNSGALLLKFKTLIPVLYSLVYVPLRALIGPIVCFAMTLNLLFSKEGQQNLPLWVRILWSMMIWAVIFGSAGEIQDCITVLQEAFLSKTGQREL